MINLGDEVKDSVTGLQGIAIGRTEWLNGCIRFVIQPPGVNKDGQVLKGDSVDEGQLKLIKANKVARSAQALEQKPGGPMPTPSRGQHL